jgi:hypothetical protein
MVASFSEAMDDRRDADVVTRRATIDALAQKVVGHVRLSPIVVRAFHRMAEGPDAIEPDNRIRMRRA